MYCFEAMEMQLTQKRGPVAMSEQQDHSLLREAVDVQDDEVGPVIRPAADIRGAFGDQCVCLRAQ